MNLVAVQKYLKQNSIPFFRLQQLKHAYFIEGKKDWLEMSVWPKELRENLASKFSWFSFELKKLAKDAKNHTTKVLLRLTDGSEIETVLIKSGARFTVCLSSQVGCQMNCLFCATGQFGFKRNLNTEEIVDQLVFWINRLRETEQKVSSVVFMGMGEPFANWSEVKEAIKILIDKNGFNMSQRHITVSTCGLVHGIDLFATQFPQANLAISLHSAIAETRRKLMPVGERYSLKDLIISCLKYVHTTNRKLFFEYTFLQGINDTEQEVMELINLLKQHYLFHLNIIPYNSTSNNLRPTTPQRLRQIVNLLNRSHVSYTIRKSAGADINAACGQLAGGRQKKGGK